VIADLRGRLACSRSVLGLRLVLLGSGAVALVLAGGGGGIALVPVVLGAFGLLDAVFRPRGLAPGVLVAGAAAGWLLRYGVDQPPAAGTLLLMLALAVAHQSAALAAAVPADARIRRDVLVRFARHGVLVVALSLVVGAVALALTRPGGSVPLETLGLVAAVVAITVPVVLSRLGDR
jgi:hypothetical protein